MRFMDKLRHVPAATSVWHRAANLQRADAAGRIAASCLTVLCLSLAVGSTSASAYSTFPDGISDQSLPNWDSGFSGSYFAGFFDSNWVAGPHIQYARYVAQWNVISGGGEARSNFENWLDDITSMGLTPDVGLTSYNGAYPSSSTEYKIHLKELLSQAKAMGHPLRYVEAWNEPNNQGNESAVNAAHFTNSAYSACEEGYGCTVIAGNVEDSSGAKAYEEEYRKNLSPTPTVWGLHPYWSVEYMNESYYTKAVEGLPNGGSGDQIWITEVAARKCTDYSGHLEEHGETGQAERAKWLVDNLIATRKPEHVFYYEFLLGGHRQPACSSSEPEDDALYVPGSDQNAEDRPRAAASFIWGGKGLPWGYTGGATLSSTERSATLTASVYPGGFLDTKYHFEYGPGLGYGSYSAEGDAGSGFGGVSESLPVGTLAAGTTYHYRVAAWNSEGTRYGADRTFTTPSPPSATTNSATGIQQEQATVNAKVNPNGVATHYYFQYGESPGYGFSTSEGNAGSGTGTESEHETITGLQPGMLYHYRVVASNIWGTTEGLDEHFATASAPSMIIDQGNDRWASEEGPSNTLDVYEAEQSTGKWAGPLQVGNENTTYSAPSLIIDKGNDRWIAAEGANHTLDVYEAEQSTGKWAGPLQVGGSGTTYSAPSLIIDQGNDRWIAVEGAKHTLDVYEAEQSTGKWAGPLQVGNENTTYSAPSLIIDQGNDRWIAAEGANHTLDVYEAEQSTGKWAGPLQVGGSGTTYSAPSLIIDKGNDRWIAAEGAGNSLDVYEAEQSTGKWAGPIQPGGSGTTFSAPSLIIDQGNDRWIAAEGAGNSLDVYEAEQSTGKWAGPLQVGGSGTTFTAPSMIIDQGNDLWVSAGGVSNTLDVYEAEQSTGRWAGPDAPELVRTTAASGITEEQATLNGLVDAKGTSSKYYFQYGETTAYGSTTPEGSAGSAEWLVSVTPVTITELQPGMTYHYRLVTIGAFGTIYGEDQTFTASSPPSLIIDKGNDRWVAVDGAKNSLDVYEAEQSTGKWAGPLQVGNENTTYSAPSLIIDKGNDRWIAAEGANHTLDVYEAEQSTGKWAGPLQVGGSGTTYSAPSLIIDQGNDRWIAVEGAKHTLDVYEAEQSTGKWAGPLQVGNENTTYSAPSLIIDQGNDRWIAAEGANHTLDVYEAEQSTGKWAGPLQVGGSGTTYSAPSLIIDKGNDRWIAAEGAGNSLDVYEAEQSTGKWAGPIQPGGSGTTFSAPSLIIDQGNDRWIAAEGAGNSLDVYEAEQSTGKWAGPLQVGGSGTTFTAPSMIIDQGNDRWVSAGGVSNTLDVYEAEQSTGRWAGPLAIGGEGTTW